MTSIDKNIYKAISNIVSRFIRVKGFEKNLAIPQNVIITYHGVSSRSKPNCVSIENFKAHLRYYKKKYKIIKLHDLVSIIKSNQPFHENLLSITFDDAYENIYHYAYPELQRMGMPATIFIPAELVGKNNEWDIEKYGKENLLKIMDYKVLREMDIDLIDFGSHGYTHAQLSRLSEQDLRIELLSSKEELEANIERKIDIIAYPHGTYSDFDQRVINKVKEYGYIAACSTCFGRYNTQEDLFSLKRISIWENDSLYELKNKLNGAYDWLAQKEKIIFMMKRLLSHFKFK